MVGPGPAPPNGDEKRGTGLVATTVVVSFLSFVVTAMRMTTRIWIVRSVGFDDYTIICATLGIIISSALVIVQVHYGFGRHKYYIEKWDYIEAMKYSYGEWIQTFQTLMFTKLSICFFLLRIPVEKRLIRPLQGAIVVLILSNIILTLLWIFQCNPIAGSWNKETPSHCFTDAQLQRIIFSQAFISIVSDFALALFPIALLWKVQIAVRIKAGLCGLMALGLITAACCIVRTIMNWQNINSDPTWASIDNWYWRSFEVCIGIVAASIPALRPGYRTVSASISSYLSRRTLHKKNTAVATLDPNSDKLPIAKTKDNTFKHSKNPLRAAARTASIEADRAQELGAGDDGFAMKSLPGDKRTMDEGIKKTIRVDVDIESQKSLGLGGSETGEGNTSFI